MSTSRRTSVDYGRLGAKYSSRFHHRGHIRKKFNPPRPRIFLSSRAARALQLAPTTRRPAEVQHSSMNIATLNPKENQKSNRRTKWSRTCASNRTRQRRSSKRFSSRFSRKKRIIRRRADRRRSRSQISSKIASKNWA